MIGWDKKHHCDKIAPLSEEAILVFHYITLGRDPDDYMFLRANGEPWGKGHQGRPFEEAAEALEKKVSIYTLRHTVITEWLQHDVDKDIVAKTLNTSPKMVDDHYNHVKAHKTSEDISAKIPKLVEWGEVEKAILDKYRNEHAEKMAKKMKLNFPLSSLHPSAYFGKIDGGRTEAPPPKPRPTAAELADLVKQKPVSVIAELYETSHPTVKKWCKQAGIEVPGRGEWQKRKAQERIAIKRAEGGLFSGGTMPSREELEPLIWSLPATEVGKRYGVKGPTVLKWAAKLEIRCPGPGYWSKVDGQRKREEKRARRQAWKEQQSKKS